jgi:tetratricopeptide (TPR) repeat protein/predicted Ser/Thr protein kinase
MPEDVEDTLPPIGEDETTATRSSSSQPSGAETGSVAPGTIIGRYVVLSMLGAGAMGMVLAAYDPELDRKVALKLLKPRTGSQDAAQARLRREAQALAKLDHPNVVGVHDVGVHEGQLFVGMEFVEGQTLGEWMAAAKRPRPWPEVVRVFAEAGRGLAAAHEAGLVHRDFKPDNVMLGADGRVRVMDFGLARGHAEDEAPSEPALESSSSLEIRAAQSQSSPAVTRTGAMTGTPAYMSLEQFKAKGVDARSDQFGFCVALYEALHGERPFAGTSVMQLLHEVMHAQVREPPKGTKVPVWLRKVVVRGLSNDKDARWPSMTALLDALGNDPAVRRRKWWAVTIVAGMLAGGAWGMWNLARRDAQACAGMQSKLDGVWDDERRAAVRAAIEGTRLSYAVDTWDRISPQLDAYTRAWLAARVDACEATHRGEQSGELLDLRMACLDERLSHVRATVEVLAAADKTVVEKAVAAVADLPGLERCADVNALKAEIPPPEDPEVAQRVAELDEQLIEARALSRAGKYAEALTKTEAVVQEADTLGYDPLQVQARLLEGDLQALTGNFEQARAALEQAYDAAVGLRMAAEAAEASRDLVYVLGDQLARHEAGRQWAKHAEPLARAAGTDEALAGYLHNVGDVSFSEGKYDEARGYQERALAIQEKALGAEHLELASILNSLAGVAWGEGKYVEARGYLERALAIQEKALGAGHPEVANSLSNLGVLAKSEGKLEQARAHGQRALAIWETTQGPEHPDVAYALANLGSMFEAEGKHEDSSRHYARALAIWEKALGPDHPNVAFALNGLGGVALAEGKTEEARVYYERALASKEKTLGVDHPEVAYSLNNLGLVMRAEGKLDAARAYLERALAVREKALGLEHPDVAASIDNLGILACEEAKYTEAYGYFERALGIREKALSAEHPDMASSLTGLGQALLGQGKPADARGYLERALSIRTANEVDPLALAETRFALAQALWDASIEAGADRARARELAELARDVYVGAGEVVAKQRGDVQRWLVAHEG